MRFSAAYRPGAAYAVISLAYWAFTLSDGALRMLVVLYFHGLGYSPLEVAMLFVLYEFFGMVTNLLGGWLATRIGLNLTMQLGLALQVLALGMLLVNESLLTVVWVMLAQALSGIAKDLNKMSAKSSVKSLLGQVQGSGGNTLYRWVALLTGSKNAMKGVGFFLGGLLLSVLGFRGAVFSMACALALVLLVSMLLLGRDLGRTEFKPRFTDLLSKSPAINRLSAARFFLFASRDIWFVLALPVYLQTQRQWDAVAVGTLLACWVIGYGLVQGLAPMVTGRHPPARVIGRWGLLLSLPLLLLAAALALGLQQDWLLVAGLLLFGAVFAINSALHSYFIVHWARQDGVSLDVGFYYMANAGGRLLGTVLSGLVYQLMGLVACLLLATGFVILSALLAGRLQEQEQEPVQSSG
ncbi:MAG: organoarsenical effux MFS transporter ArsJ [Pseudomonadales bacterium]|nr:organoarsenical effux MFS transporter ArsJ [Pseudomonadales bacterium]